MARGRKPSHLTLVDAADQVDEPPAGDRCGAPTKSGAPCRRKTGGGPCKAHRPAAAVGPECPLPLTERERELWSDVVGQLTRAKTVRAASWPSIYGLVTALDQLDTAKRELASAAATVTGDNGAPKKHPANTIVNQMLGHVMKFTAELGLTPSSLAKVGLDPGEPSEMDDLISGR